MYHPYQNQVAKRIVKERREHADMARRVAQAGGDHAKLWIRLRARLALLVSGLIERPGERKSAEHGGKAVPHVSTLAEEKGMPAR